MNGDHKQYSLRCTSGREGDGLPLLPLFVHGSGNLRVSILPTSHRLEDGAHALGSNVLGGNFALVGVPSVGASGAIFGTTAVSHPITHPATRPLIAPCRLPGLTCLRTGAINTSQRRRSVRRTTNIIASLRF